MELNTCGIFDIFLSKKAVVTQVQVNKFQINLLLMSHLWWNKTKLLFEKKILCIDEFILVKMNFILST